MCSFISGCFQFNFWTPLPIESGSFIYSDKPCHLLSACTCDKTSVESHPYSMFVYVDTWQGNTRTQCPGPNIVDHNRGSGQTGFTPTACRLWHRQWRVGPAAEEEREGGLLVNKVLSYTSNSSFGFSSSYLRVLRPIWLRWWSWTKYLGHRARWKRWKAKTQNTKHHKVFINIIINYESQVKVKMLTTIFLPAG